MGPILIFDKSALQSFSVDEAVWLHSFYSANITPLFFIETLADLQKEMKRGRRPEDVVGNLAVKTSPMGARPNVHHDVLCRSELMGSRVEMRGVPVISGGQTVVLANWTGAVFRPSPEQEALERWQRSEFLSVERQFARAWRAKLVNVDFAEWKWPFRRFEKPRTFAEARTVAIRTVDRDGWRYRTLRTAMEASEVSGEEKQDVIRRWRAAGGPRVREFAPFTAHVLTVEAFFGLCLHSGLIWQKSSNRVDVSYLCYLPFCMIFTSGDNLHAEIVPLFLRPDQAFVKAAELKADLASLDAHFSRLPEETRAQGVMRFAHYPPTEGEFLTSKLWDRLMAPTWRDDAIRPPELSGELQGALLEMVRKMSDEATSSNPEVNLETAGGLLLESRVPIRMGKWRLLPPEVETRTTGGP